MTRGLGPAPYASVYGVQGDGRRELVANGQQTLTGAHARVVSIGPGITGR
ncbi:hypothetical protein [Streptomyces sp. NPDC001843]